MRIFRVPGIDPSELAKLFESSKNRIVGHVPPAVRCRFTVVFAIRIMPYISASIIIQLGSEISSEAQGAEEGGRAGRRKITSYTRYGTVPLATFQSFVYMVMLFRQPGLVVTGQVEFYLTTVVTLVTGTMFLMWLGEQIGRARYRQWYFAGIICAGIAAGYRPVIGKDPFAGESGLVVGSVRAGVVYRVMLVTALVVFFERGQRKSPGQLCQAPSGHR